MNSTSWWLWNDISSHIVEW